MPKRSEGDVSPVNSDVFVFPCLYFVFVKTDPYWSIMFKILLDVDIYWKKFFLRKSDLFDWRFILFNVYLFVLFYFYCFSIGKELSNKNLYLIFLKICYYKKLYSQIRPQNKTELNMDFFGAARAAGCKGSDLGFGNLHLS